MLISFFYIFVFGMIFAYIFNKLKMPSLLGMMITGILVGPHCFNLLDEKILFISSDLRQFCLIIILIRAGLALDIKDLKKVGRPAILMSFVPALFEIVGMILIAPRVLGISVLEAGILGTVIAAVSPAVIVPKMLKLMDENYGKKHSIPQLIMAGASVDDVFVIVLFTSFIGLALGQNL
ncbi:MAG: sodium:proton antiporter, partial [Erysipelotrichia bacterium]|nr:sodium:proton antiporter [Erysipelotrichia bacterium]